MKLADIIDTFITGDWGEESPTQDTPNAAYCVRGADIVPITNHNFTDIPQRYVCDRTKETKLLAAGDLVIEKSGGSPTQSTGRIVYVSEDLIKAKGNVVCSNFCTAFRVKAGWNPLYVYYFWQNVYNHGAFFNFEGKTSGIKNLQLDNALSAIDIEYLPLEKQNQIVASLASIDEKIKVNRQINDNLEAMAKQLYDYWFVQFDFPNEEGKPYKSSGGAMVWNDKLKREIPQGWSISNVKSLIEPIERGISYSSDDLLDPFATPMINLACFSKAGDYRLGEMKFFSGKVSNDKLISPMDMLIACTDMTQGADIIGRPILASDEYDQYTFSTDLALITPKGKFKMYLYYTLRTPFYHKYIRPFASGTTVKHLNLIGVENYGLPVPPIGIQSKFEDLITPIKEKQSKNLNEINALTKQRDELLPLLMNGQASVNYHLSASTSISFDISVLFLNFTNGNSLYETISLDYQCFALPLHSKENTHGTIQEDKRHIQQRQRQGDKHARERFLAFFYKCTSTVHQAAFGNAWCY